MELLVSLFSCSLIKSPFISRKVRVTFASTRYVPFPGLVSSVQPGVPICMSIAAGKKGPGIFPVAFKLKNRFRLMSMVYPVEYYHLQQLYHSVANGASADRKEVAVICNERKKNEKPA